jgi:hypothetical protein
MTLGQPSLFSEPSQSPSVSEPDPGLHRGKSIGVNKYVSSVWSFAGAGGDQVYRWYGTLPAPLIERLFTLYGVADGSFLDGFLGLGVSLEIADAYAMTGIGLDVNPLACLAAKTRLQPIDSQEAVKRAGNRILARLESSESKSPALRALKGDQFGYMRKWFREDSLAATVKLLFEIASIKDASTQRVFFVAAAQVIRQVASVDSRCTHHLVTKNKPYIRPAPLWRAQVDRVMEALSPARAMVSQPRVIQASVLDEKSVPKGNQFVLLHPPYLGVIHYHLIHRLSTDLFHLVQQEADPKGLRSYRFEHEHIREGDISTDRSDRYSQSVKQLGYVMKNAVEAGGRCVVIVGDQRDKGLLRHPFTEFVSSFEENGFALEELFIWVLQNNGGMHVLRRGHFIDHNYILVFKRR